MMRQQVWQQNDLMARTMTRDSGERRGMYMDNGNAMKQAVRIVGAPRNAGKRVCFWAIVGVGKDVADGRGTSKEIWEQCCALKEMGSH